MCFAYKSRVGKYGFYLLVSLGEFASAQFDKCLRTLQLFAESIDVEFVVFHLADDGLKFFYCFFVFHCLVVYSFEMMDVIEPDASRVVMVSPGFTCDGERRACPSARVVILYPRFNSRVGSRELARCSSMSRRWL